MNENGIPVEIKAWAAGFWEGEGSVTIARRLSKRSRHGFAYRLRVRVSQTKVKPLQLLQGYWGGSLSSRKRFGRTQETYDWAISCRLGAKFLNDIYPYLKFRHRLAEIGLELADTMSNGNQLVTEGQFKKRETLRQEVFELNGYYRRKHGES